MAASDLRSTPRGRARRQDVLEAALEAFATNGYRGASVGAIAKQCGLSEPGLLHHFPSKTALLMATLQTYERKAWTEASTVGPSAAAGYRQRMLRLAASHERDPRFVRLLLVIAAESTEAGHPAREWMQARYRAALKSAEQELAADQADGRLDPDVDVRLLAQLVNATLDGLEQQFLLSHGTVDIVTPFAAFLDQFYVR
jgi:AcrR family transcriptional regulator